jgi:hypothetical protein
VVEHPPEKFAAMGTHAGKPRQRPDFKTGTDMNGISPLRPALSPAHSPSQHEVSAAIDRWARQGGPNEARAQAAARMQDCLHNDAPLLILEGLGLASLPPEIGRLTSLEALHLSRNQLESLPESIGDLAQLRVLYVDQNRLAQLPDSLGRLRDLQVLNAHSNQLARLPDSFAELHHLRLLWLHGNPLEILPDYLLRLPPSALEDMPLLHASQSQLVQLQQNIATTQALESLAARLSSQDHRDFPRLPPDIWRSLRDAVTQASPSSSASLRTCLEAWLNRAAEQLHRQ